MKKAKSTPIQTNGKIKMKKLISYEIKVSHDINDFKPVSKPNRNLVEKQVLKVEGNIKENGYFPTIATVNSNMEFLRGQHFAHACARLKLPILYCICEDMQPDEIVAVDNTRINMRWTDAAALNAFGKCGNEVSIKLENLYRDINASIKKIKGRKVTVIQFVSLFYNNSSYLFGSVVKGGGKIFGKLPTFSDIEQKNGIENIGLFVQLQKNCMLPGMRRLNAQVAFVEFLSKYGDFINKKRFSNKLQNFKLNLGGKANDYLKQYKDLYNWGESTKNQYKFN